MSDGRDYGLFWDSVSGDRLYSSDAFAELFSNYFTTGVFNGGMKVVHDTDMTIEVLSGWVNIEGRCKKFEQTDDLVLEAAHSQYPRNDAVVVYADYVNRNIGIRVQTGSYSGQSAPLYTPVRTSEMYELILAYVYVGAGVTEIDQSNITDKRFDTSVCGIVTGTVEQIDLGTITNQFSTAFSNWFNNIKGQLSTDAAGNLQNQIDELASSLTASEIYYNNTNNDIEGDKVQDAIDELDERIVKVEPTVKRIDNQLTANSKPIYLDYHDGKYGYNTDPERGADTFNPFNNGGNRSIFKLGALGGTFDLSDYVGYENFTVADNFFIQVSSFSSYGTSASAGISDWDGTSFSAEASYSGGSISNLLSYDASTGVLTTKYTGTGTLSVSATTATGHNGGTNRSSSNQQLVATGTVYLIIDESPLDLIYNALVYSGVVPQSKGEGDIIYTLKNRTVVSCVLIGDMGTEHSYVKAFSGLSKTGQSFDTWGDSQGNGSGSLTVDSVTISCYYSSGWHVTVSSTVAGTFYKGGSSIGHVSAGGQLSVDGGTYTFVAD